MDTTYRRRTTTQIESFIRDRSCLHTRIHFKRWEASILKHLIFFHMSYGIARNTHVDYPPYTFAKQRNIYTGGNMRFDLYFRLIV